MSLSTYNLDYLTILRQISLRRRECAGGKNRKTKCLSFPVELHVVYCAGSKDRPRTTLSKELLGLQVCFATNVLLVLPTTQTSSEFRSQQVPQERHIFSTSQRSSLFPAPPWQICNLCWFYCGLGCESIRERALIRPNWSCVGVFNTYLTIYHSLFFIIVKLRLSLSPS